MAIQLSERDNQIFRFIDEHQVLLEKHIAWFISCDEKPVLIRDRLRKLFYLDYLLCERHGGKLPWWTTPTKPLVYTLSPLTRQIVKAGEMKMNLNDAESQRHLLEVANLRMLYLMDQKDGTISDFQWNTVRKSDVTVGGIDATVSYKRNGTECTSAVMNHPMQLGNELVVAIQKTLTESKVDNLIIISRDDAHMAKLQNALAGTSVASRVLLTTHQEVYKSGMSKTKWQSAVAQPSASTSTMPAINWSANLSPAQAY
jgi:hypothetical protein